MAMPVFLLLAIGATANAVESINQTCPNLGSIMDCGKRLLKEIPGELPGWVQTLRLDSNFIQHIRVGAFQGVNDLEELVLSKNKLEDLNGDTICIELPNLRILKLSKNILTAVPDLQKCGNLVELYLSSNRIVTISPSALYGLKHLQLLDLSRNMLSELRKDTFPLQLNVKQLVLTDNRLAVVDGSSLAAFESLERLHLGKNRLTQLPTGLFLSAPNLQELDLSRNRFRTVQFTTFKDLGSLKNLSLRHNQIEMLANGAFFECKQLEVLDLAENRLEELKVGPFFGLSNIKELLLAGNNISSIDEQIWEQAKVVSVLDLSRNNLSRLASSGFNNLKTLRVLLLNNNNLLHIEDHALDGLVLLEKLDLSTNHLSDTLLSSAEGVFSQLAQLSVLDLRNNVINSISYRLFHGLAELSRLTLGGNPITTVESDAFGELRKLIVLEMNSAKLICDCKLAWLPPWVKVAAFISSVTGTCQEPSRLRGHSIFDAAVGDFVCDATFQSPSPNVTVWPPPVTNVLKGANTTLLCQAATRGSAGVLQALWRKDNEVVRDGSTLRTETRAKTDDAMMSVFTTVLHITNVTYEDEGRYQCGFANEFGRVFSPKVELKVLVYPQFSVLPASVKAKADQDVSIKCAATGHPPPEISIQKDIGHNFPSARDRRFSFNQETNEFIIKKIKAEDAGVYYCVARNEAGANMANATVDVLEPPRFLDGIDCPTGEHSRMTVLSCSVDGSPRPHIVWLRDGAALDPSDKYIFSSFMVKLVLADTQPSDAGEYTCQASNALGKVEATCVLVVGPSSGGLLGGASASSGGDSGAAAGVAAASPSPFLDSNTITGVIVIAVVGGVVGTSVVWVVIIYQTRKKKHHCVGGGGADSNSSHTEDTLVPLASCGGSSGDRATAAVPPCQKFPFPDECYTRDSDITLSKYRDNRDGQTPTAKWCIETQANQTYLASGGACSEENVAFMNRGQTLPFAHVSSQGHRRRRSCYEDPADRSNYGDHGLPAMHSHAARSGGSLDAVVQAAEIFAQARGGDPIEEMNNEESEEENRDQWHCHFGTFQPAAPLVDTMPQGNHR